MPNTKKSQSIINEIVEKIVVNHQPERIMLFGSYAWGHPHSESDIDLLIEKETDNTRLTARDIDRTLFPRSVPIDIIVSTPECIRQRKAERDSFISKIFTDGKVLYERP